MMDYKSMTTPMTMNLKKLSCVAADSDLVDPIDTERGGKSVLSCFSLLFNLSKQTCWQHLFIQNKRVSPQHII